jgi:hypothetical protein
VTTQPLSFLDDGARHADAHVCTQERGEDVGRETVNEVAWITDRE